MTEFKPQVRRISEFQFKARITKPDTDTSHKTQAKVWSLLLRKFSSTFSLSKNSANNHCRNTQNITKLCHLTSSMRSGSHPPAVPGPCCATTNTYKAHFVPFNSFKGNSIKLKRPHQAHPLDSQDTTSPSTWQHSIYYNKLFTSKAPGHGPAEVQFLAPAQTHFVGLDRLIPLPKSQVQRRIIFSASLRGRWRINLLMFLSCPDRAQHLNLFTLI